MSDVSPMLRGARVLVVEDDPILLAQLRHLVVKWGCEARVAANGLEGLKAWHAWRPDVVLTDIVMPVMDGLAMAGAIREVDAAAQIVVVSSSEDSRHLRSALEVGIDRYVLKPVDEGLLLDALVKCLRDAHRLQELHLARMVFESAGEGVVVSDAQGLILTANPAYCDMSGYRENDLQGRRLAEVNPAWLGDDLSRDMREGLAAVGRWSGEVVNRRKSGETYPVWLSMVSVEDPARRVARYVSLMSDITERKREEERIRRLAHYDALTGLPNRVLFLDHLRRAVARMARVGGRLALLYLDLDHFKPVNDLYGHETGDRVLAEAARRMQGCMRQADTVSRRGGDEFVALLESGDAKNAAAMASRKLIEAVSAPYEIQGHHFIIGASIGIAIYPDDGTSPEALLAAADGALYTAKAEGRGDFRFHSPRDQLDTRARLSLEESLRQGVGQGAFELRYLPEIRLESGQVERVEVLLRFRHPQEGLLEPDRFLDVAERLGLLPGLGLRTLTEAARVVGQLGDGELGLTLDMSALQLAQLDEPARLAELLAEAGLPPHALTLEFPEEVVTDNEAGLKNLMTLAQAGFRISLDDFGAGFCSFSMLQQLPLSAIKIDRLFVEEIETNPQSRELVAALIAFARRLGIPTVAEGVNSPGQLDFLRDNGCESVQGFLFCEPLEDGELGPYLAGQPWLAQLRRQ
ncbi:MAG: EAL domain-containing protein [Pseudomonadota bacterium]